MKRLISFVVLFAILNVFSGCTTDIRHKDTDKLHKDTANVKVGVIETTGYKNKSYLHFFDEDLNFLYKDEVGYASLSEPFDKPFCENGEVYAIPKGEFVKRKETYIMGYDIDSGKYKLYNTKLRSMNKLAVSDEFLFGVNCINGVSNIVRCSKDDLSDVITKSFKQLYILDIFVSNEKLYAVINDKKDRVFFTELSIGTLEVVEQYDVTSYGSPCDLIECENKIYISNQYQNETLGTPGSSLTVFDTETKKFREIQLTEYYPNNLVIKDNLLFVSHYDLVQNRGNKISVINLDNYDMETFELTHSVGQLSICDEYFYILGDNCIYKYSYDGYEFTQIKKADISVDKSGTFFYVASFFINE